MIRYRSVKRNEETKNPKKCNDIGISYSVTRMVNSSPLLGSRSGKIIAVYVTESLAQISEMMPKFRCKIFTIHGPYV